MRVLLIADQRETLTNFASLAAQGHEVRTLQETAVVLTTTFDFQPEVIFIDSDMPGMKRIEIARLLRLHPRLDRIFLVALIGHGNEAEDQLKGASFDACLTRPIETQALQTLILAASRRSVDLHWQLPDSEHGGSSDRSLKPPPERVEEQIGASLAYL